MAESDRAFDRWESTSPASGAYDDRKAAALAAGDRCTRACASHIGAVTLTDARRVLSRVDDPAELERRQAVAREHDEWWREGA
jgi:hypothetical protein